MKILNLLILTFFLFSCNFHQDKNEIKTENIASKNTKNKNIKNETLLKPDTFVSKGSQIVLIAPTEKELDELLDNDTTNIENDIYDDFSYYANKLYSEYEDSGLSIVLPTESVIEIIAFDGTKSYLNKKEMNEKYGYIINSVKREPIVEFGIFTDEEIIKRLNKNE